MADSNRSPLHQAIEENDLELVKELLDQGHDTCLQNELGMNSLHLAVEKGHFKIAQLLVEEYLCIDSMCGPSKDSQVCYVGYTPLHFSSKNGDEQITTLLLSNDAHPNIQEKSGNTPLHLAILKQATKIVRLLLENEYIDNFINVQNNSKESALHVAAASGYEDIITDLLKSGADTKLRDVHGNTPLHLACENGNRTVVQVLLSNSNEEVNSQNNAWRTPLHNAIRKNDQELIELLLEFEASSTLTDEHGDTPLHHACESNHPENVEILIKHGSLVNARNFQEKTPLHVAVDIYSIYLRKYNMGETTNDESFDKNNEMIINLLQENGASLYASDKLGNTPFHYAALYNNLEYVHLFLDWDSDIVDYINFERKTALLIASENKSVNSVIHLSEKSDIKSRNTDIIELLLNKANPNLCDMFGNSTLHYACINNNLEDVQLFLNHGCSVNTKNNEGKTPIIIVAQTKSSKLVKSYSEENVKNDFRAKNNNIIVNLLSRGADLNISDAFGNTPLHYSCVNNNFERVQLFLKHGCQINSQNNEGKTPLQIAASYMSAKVEESLFADINDISENTKILNVLLENSANPNVHDEHGNTPLHYACLSNNYEHVQMFLKYNSNVNFQNNEKKTALTIAAEYLPTVSGEAKLRKGLQSKSQAENNRIVRKLLKSGAVVNIVDELGNTPLHYACLNNKLEQVNVLLIHGCNVNVQNNAKKSALLIAIDYGLIETRALLLETSAKDSFKQRNSKIVELLLQYNANTALCDEFQNTPLNFACINNNYTQVDMILNNSGDVNQVNHEGKTALHVATQSHFIEKWDCKDFKLNNLKIMNRLLSCSNANTDLFDKYNNTPLHYACMNNNYEQVKLLLKYGCNVNFKNINSDTCLQLTLNYVSIGLLQNVDFKNENVKIVKALLEAGTYTKSSNDFGNTPLHYACINNNLECVKLLIKNGCGIDSENNEGKTALNLLIETQSSNSPSLSTEQCDPNSEQTIEEFLLDGGADVNTSDDLGNTPSHYACLNNNLDHVKLLQKKHVYFDSKNKYGETALIIAAKQTQLDSVVTANRLYDIVKIICPYYVNNYKLKNSKDRTEYIRQRDMFGNTVFHYACSNSHLECVKYLIDACEINARNNEGKTPLHMAAEMRSTHCTPNESVAQNGTQLDVQSRNTEIIKLLLEKGADIKLFDHFGNTALHFACINNDFENAELFITHGCNVNSRNNAGKSALHILAESNSWKLEDKDNESFKTKNKQLVKLLITYGANPNLIDKSGNTSLHYACVYNNFDHVQLFVKHDCSVNYQNKDMKSALITACENRITESVVSTSVENRNYDGFTENIQIVDFLLKSGAITNLVDKYGNTALHYACMNTNVEQVRHLLKRGCYVNYQNGDKKSALIIVTENTPTVLEESTSEESPKRDVYMKNMQIIELLLKSGANIELFDEDGNTALHYACINVNIEQVRRFLKYGCVVISRNENNKTVFDIATDNNSNDIVDLLTEYRANIKTA